MRLHRGRRARRRLRRRRRGFAAPTQRVGRAAPFSLLKEMKKIKKSLILVADDEHRIRKLVSDFLRNAGFDVITAEDGAKALELFYANSAKIALVVLDVMMPEADGWQVLSELRKESSVPVLMLTAKGEDADQLLAFKTGADDYVTKPFSPSVLVARVQSLLKRSGRGTAEQISIADVTVDVSSRILNVEGNDISLTPREYELLLYLYNNRNIVISREKLLNAVWSYDYFGDARTVDTHVKQLRAKLRGSADILQTVRGIGYRLVV